MADERLTFILEARDLTSGVTRKVRSEVSGLDKVMGGLRTQFTLANVAGNLITDGIRAVGAAMRESVGEAIDFQTNMLNVNSIAKLSEQDFAAASQGVLDLSKQLPQSANTLAKGLYDIASSGFKGADGMEVLEQSARAASAGLTTTEVSAAGLTAVLNAYHLSSDQAARISDIMFQTVNLGVVTFEELSSAIGTTTALSAPLGVSFEEVSAALSLMTRNGIDAENATTQINAIMTNLLKPSTQAVRLAEELGLGWDAQALKAKGLSGVLTELVAKTGGNHEQMAVLLGDQRAIRGAFVLAADGGAALNAELGKMHDATGATTSALSEQEKGLAFQLNILANNFQALVTEGLQAVLPAIAEFSRMLRTDVLPVLKTLGPILALLADKIIPALAIVIGVKLVAALKAMELRAKLAGLATKGMLGPIGLLLIAAEGLGAARGAVDDFLTEFMRGKEAATAIQALNAEMGDIGPLGKVFAEKLYDLGISTEEFATVVEASSGDVRVAFREIVDAGGDLSQAMAANATTMTVGWAQAWKAAAPSITWATYGAVVVPVEHAGKAAVAAYRLSKEEVTALAAQTPSDIAAAIISGKVDIAGIRQRMREIIAHPVSDAKTEAQNAALLISPAIALGLASNSTQVKAEMLAEVVEPTLKSLLTLNPRVFQAGADLPPALARAVKQNGPLAVQAMRDLVGDQKAPLGQLAEIAEGQGLAGVAALIRGMGQKKQAAKLEAAAIARAVAGEMYVDASSGGRSVAQSWVNGIVDELLKQLPTVNNASRRFMQGTFGTSMPTSGPFAHPEKGAISIVDKFTQTMGEQIQRNMGGIQGSMPTLRAGLAGGYSSAASGSSGGGGLTINFNSTFPPTPAQGAELARTIGPELTRWQRRNG